MKISQGIDGFRKFMRATGYTEPTIELYQYVLRVFCEFLHDCDIEKVKYDDIENYFEYLRCTYVPKRKNGNTEPVSGSTLQRHWTGIRAFYTWATRMLHLRKRPDAGFKLPANNNPKVIVPFTQEDIETLCKAAQFHVNEGPNRKTYTSRRRTGYRDHAMIVMLFDTGLRIGELCRLNVKDVDFDNGHVWIAPFHNTNRKTKSRIVHLGKSAQQYLWLYMSKRVGANPSDPLFVSDRGNKRMTPNGARLLLKDLGDKAGITDVHPHRFRHSFCIWFLRNDGDLFNLQAITGHTSLDMLHVYMKIATGDTSRAHKRASPADNFKL